MSACSQRALVTRSLLPRVAAAWLRYPPWCRNCPHRLCLLCDMHLPFSKLDFFGKAHSLRIVPSLLTVDMHRSSFVKVGVIDSKRSSQQSTTSLVLKNISEGYSCLNVSTKLAPVTGIRNALFVESTNFN